MNNSPFHGGNTGSNPVGGRQFTAGRAGQSAGCKFHLGKGLRLDHPWPAHYGTAKGRQRSGEAQDAPNKPVGNVFKPMSYGAPHSRCTKNVQ